MKIVVVGNTNNYPLALALALREQEIDAHLVVTEKELLHRPENTDSGYYESYPHWIHDFSYLDIEDYIAPTTKIFNLLLLMESADGLILNHYGPSLLHYIDKPAISLMTGSDITYIADFATLDTLSNGWGESVVNSQAASFFRDSWQRFISRQRDGIKRSIAVSTFPKGLLEDTDRILADIGVEDNNRIHLYYTGACGNQKKTLATKTITIFYGSRLTWRDTVDPGTCILDKKGIDVFLYGFSKFLSKSNNPVCLRIVEKGTHIEQTKKLVKELEVDNYVTWLKEMPKHTFDMELQNADICVEQLTHGAYGMVALDALAAGKPLIANTRPEVWRNSLVELPPICHASSPDEVCEQLVFLSSDEIRRKEIGNKGIEFINKYWSSEASAKRCLELFKSST